MVQLRCFHGVEAHTLRRNRTWSLECGSFPGLAGCGVEKPVTNRAAPAGDFAQRRARGSVLSALKAGQAKPWCSVVGGMQYVFDFRYFQLLMG